MGYSFEDEKAVYEARKRDHLRSKLRPSKRALAKIEADELVDAHIKLKKRETEMNDRNVNRAVYDEAMESAIQGLRQDNSIKKIVL
mgnify:FL=1